MYISVNERNEIKEVGVSSDPSLTSLYVDENSDMFPFKGWSDAKICCYKVNVVDGIVMMLTPYVDSRMIEHFDQVGRQTEEVASNLSGLYDSNKAYSQDEYCLWNNNLYRFNYDNGKGIEPSNNVYWTLCDIATELNRLFTMIKEN